MLTYESVCDKLGFDFMSYNPVAKGTEYDGDEENPFKKLTLEELNFVIQYAKNNNIRN